MELTPKGAQDAGAMLYIDRYRYRYRYRCRYGYTEVSSSRQKVHRMQVRCYI